MDEKISLKYGEETVEIDVRGAASIETILPKPMERSRICAKRSFGRWSRMPSAV